MFTKDQLNEILLALDSVGCKSATRLAVIESLSALSVGGYAANARPECMIFGGSESVMIRMSYMEVTELRAVREELDMVDWTDIPLTKRIYERLVRNTVRLRGVCDELDYRLTDGGFFG